VEAAARRAVAAARRAGRFVFAGSADPVVLDGALVSDGESIRPIQNIFEGLVSLKTGTTEIIPGLATSWDSSPDGKTWTFHLREGVKFQDGTDFDAAAVCFNFDRWYGFKGSFQNSSATYYWQTVFGGFKQNEKANESLGTSLYSNCTAKDSKTAVIVLTKPSASFLGALSLSAFGIASPDALKKYGADKGTVDADGVFHPTGTFGTEHPIGTGAFKFESWTRGDKLTLVRYDDYWGEKAKLDKLIIRPIADNAARLQALQAGEIQGYDNVEPQDIATIKGDSNLQVLDRPAFNVAYVGFNQSKPPLDKLEVRQAIAYGLDRKTVVDSFYAGRGTVAKEFMPPEVTGYADDVTEYTYDAGQVEVAAPEGGPDAAGEDRLLVPDGRLGSVHAGSESGTSRRSLRASRRPASRSCRTARRGARTTSARSTRARRRCTSSAGRATTAIPTTSSARSSARSRRRGARSTSRTTL